MLEAVLGARRATRVARYQQTCRATAKRTSEKQSSPKARFFRHLPAQRARAQPLVERARLKPRGPDRRSRSTASARTRHRDVPTRAHRSNGRLSSSGALFPLRAPKREPPEHRFRLGRGALRLECFRSATPFRDWIDLQKPTSRLRLGLLRQGSRSQWPTSRTVRPRRQPLWLFRL